MLLKPPNFSERNVLLRLNTRLTVLSANELLMRPSFKTKRDEENVSLGELAFLSGNLICRSRTLTFRLLIRMLYHLAVCYMNLV